MSEHTGRVALACPSCSPDTATPHEVLKEAGLATVRCADCGHVHKEELEEPETVEIDVVVSQDGESLTARVETEADESVGVGDEFIVDTPEAIMQVRVTSVEIGPEMRAEQAAASEVETVWTRAVDNVTVKATVHTEGGQDEGSRSERLQVPGDYEFVVGEVGEFGDEKFEVQAIVVREEGPEYRHGKLDHEGDMAFAKDVKRVYGRDESSQAWSPW
ncbi:HVO_0476 family zinc finger protein [Halobium salinum]|uniref:HVO_0476 family zinc finger protein n=1 Tax=Halobium salinum TaxID=1364940 RepID=A0ABD5PBV3_9EURY|nr:HVO_0476 family zinc finger protein [Halobium salinum]